MDIEMNRYLVVVMDAARARFFRLRDTDNPEIESGPNLVETGDLFNPENEMKDENVFSETKAGANMSSGNGKMHQYDDHRTRHQKEFIKRFAGQVAHETMRRGKTKGTRDIIIVANPAILGVVRSGIESKSKGRDVTIHAIDKDASKLAPRDIHELMAAKELIPPRRPSTGQMGARRRQA